MRRTEFCRSRGLSFGTLDRHLKTQRWNRRSRTASSIERLVSVELAAGKLPTQRQPRCRLAVVIPGGRRIEELRRGLGRLDAPVQEKPRREPRDAGRTRKLGDPDGFLRGHPPDLVYRHGNPGSGRGPGRLNRPVISDCATLSHQR